MPVRFNGKRELIVMILTIGGLPLIAMICSLAIPLEKTEIVAILLLFIAFIVWMVFRKKN